MTSFTESKRVSSNETLLWGGLTMTALIIVYLLLAYIFPSQFLNSYIFDAIPTKYILLIIPVLAFISSIIKIDETKQGLISILGKRQKMILAEGYHWLPPFFSAEIYDIKEQEFAAQEQEIYSANQISFLLSYRVHWTITDPYKFSNLQKDFLPNAFIGLLNDSIRNKLGEQQYSDMQMLKFENTLLSKIIQDCNFDCQKWGVKITRLYINKAVPSNKEVESLYNSKLALDTILDKVLIFTDKLGMSREHAIKLIQIERGKMSSQELSLSIDEQVTKLLTRILK